MQPAALPLEVTPEELEESLTIFPGPRTAPVLQEGVELLPFVKDATKGHREGSKEGRILNAGGSQPGTRDIG